MHNDADDLDDEAPVQSDQGNVRRVRLSDIRAQARARDVPASDMTMDELTDALDDPEHMRHAEAVEANRQLAAQLAPAMQNLRALVDRASGLPAIVQGVSQVGKDEYSRRHADSLRQLSAYSMPELPDPASSPIMRTAEHLEDIGGMIRVSEARAQASLDVLQAMSATLNDQKSALVALVDGSRDEGKWNRRATTLVVILSTLALVAAVVMPLIS